MLTQTGRLGIDLLDKIRLIAKPLPYFFSKIELPTQYEPAIRFQLHQRHCPLQAEYKVYQIYNLDLCSRSLPENLVFAL